VNHYLLDLVRRSSGLDAHASDVESPAAPRPEAVLEAEMPRSGLLGTMDRADGSTDGAPRPAVTPAAGMQVPDSGWEAPAGAAVADPPSPQAAVDADPAPEAGDRRIAPPGPPRTHPPPKPRRETAPSSRPAPVTRDAAAQPATAPIGDTASSPPHAAPDPGTAPPHVARSPEPKVSPAAAPAPAVTVPPASPPAPSPVGVDQVAATSTVVDPGAPPAAHHDPHGTAAPLTPPSDHGSMEALPPPGPQQAESPPPTDRDVPRPEPRGRDAVSFDATTSPRWEPPQDGPPRSRDPGNAAMPAVMTPSPESWIDVGGTAEPSWPALAATRAIAPDPGEPGGAARGGEQPSVLEPVDRLRPTPDPADRRRAVRRTLDQPASVRPPIPEPAPSPAGIEPRPAAALPVVPSPARGPETPRWAARSVEVRIGAVEVRAPAVARPPTWQPRPVQGFDAYHHVRTYERR
jgi:hypothetical protein